MSLDQAAGAATPTATPTGELVGELAGELAEETEHSLTALDLEFTWSGRRPVALRRVLGSELVRQSPIPMVSVFTAEEQRQRSSQGYIRSTVGERLRYTRHWITTGAGGRRLHIEQSDPVTGLSVTTVVEHPDGLSAYRFSQQVVNNGSASIALTAVTSLSLGLGSRRSDVDSLDLCWGESEWLAEGRWHQQPLRKALPYLNLPLHGQDARGRWARTSHGAWSTGAVLPCGVITGKTASVAWQIETSGPWHVELEQTATAAVLVATGPALEHDFVASLAPGGGFDTVPVAAVFVRGDRDAAFGALTRYRRWLRTREQVSPESSSGRSPEPTPRNPSRISQRLPVVYNDFMNTLMGEPSTEKLLPLIEAAAAAGAEYFCIDAGWFADPTVGDWWSTVGEWREARNRFTGGLKAVIDTIHAHGMGSGLWLEPEVVGADSPIAAVLPDEAFFHRRGARVKEAHRFHLDFRHPAARDHLDTTVDHLVAEYGISFLKLDYNIDPGAGTEIDATSAAVGLLDHTRAYRRWLQDLKRRHPGLLIENCASGAMRMDYALLSVTDLQSTTDQQDYRLYPPIAVAAPASILPEQCGNWAYPAVTMSDEETAFSLVAGMVGRLYLSGFLHTLRPQQSELVADAVRIHKQIRDQVADSVPQWPLGFPEWDDEVMALVLGRGSDRLLAVWSRAAGSREVSIPGRFGRTIELYPAREDLGTWSVHCESDRLLLDIPAGPTARLFRLTVSGDAPTGS